MARKPCSASPETVEWTLSNLLRMDRLDNGAHTTGAMIRPDVPVSPERLRRAVIRAVLSTSLRQVARDVGMSPTGLDNYVLGITEPYPKTRRKLEEWYVRSAAGQEGISAVTAAAALTLLLDGIAPELVDRARERVVEAVRAAHREGGTSPPAWVAPGEASTGK